jgi:hypothetical protein
VTAVVDKPPLPLSAARVAAPSSEEIGAKVRILIERFTKLAINRSWVNIDQVSYWFQIPTNPLSKESFPRARHLELLDCPCLVDR